MVVVLSHGSDKPWCTTGASPSPVLFEIVFTGFNSIVRKEDDETNEGVEGGVNKETTKRKKEKGRIRVSF